MDKDLPGTPFRQGRLVQLPRDRWRAIGAQGPSKDLRFQLQQILNQHQQGHSHQGQGLIPLVDADELKSACGLQVLALGALLAAAA